MEANNTKIIRDALVKIHDLTNALDEECGVDPVEVRDIAREALSTTPRNCDIMSRPTCTKHFSTIYEGNRDGLCDVQTEREKNIHLYYIAFNKWLFAPADGGMASRAYPEPPSTSVRNELKRQDRDQK